jgi:replication factor C subunit 2/4
MKYYSWVEKNRPKNLEEVCYQDDVKKILKNFITNKNIPHLLFFGPSGCGKTSTILSLARDLFGNEYKNRIKELNASDERGINVIREKIKNYAQESISINNNLPPWKIIILDEADNMTIESQYALRRIMEEYSKVTRFCIICNYHNKIIDPIVSRCSLFRFKPIPDKIIKSQLTLISNKENFNCTNKVLEKICSYCRGDLRKAINFLQRCNNCFGDKITSMVIDEISGVISLDKLEKFIENCINKNEKEVLNFIEFFYYSGYSLVNQVFSLHNILIKSKITDESKCNIILILIEIDQNLIKGSDELIQMHKLAYFIMRQNNLRKT